MRGGRHRHQHRQRFIPQGFPRDIPLCPESRISPAFRPGSADFPRVRRTLGQGHLISGHLSHRPSRADTPLCGLPRRSRPLSGRDNQGAEGFAAFRWHQRTGACLVAARHGGHCRRDRTRRPHISWLWPERSVVWTTVTLSYGSSLCGITSYAASFRYICLRSILIWRDTLEIFRPLFS